MRWFTLSLLILLSVTCNNPKEVSIKPEDDLSFQTEVNKLKQSYETYLKMNEGEILRIWYLVTKDCEFMLDGDSKAKKLDCYGGYSAFFKAVGANLVNENIELISKRVKRLHEMNQIIIYKDGNKSIAGYDNIRRGSIIIFYNSKMQISWHVGIIFGSGNRILQFTEMSGLIGRSNYANISYDADNIFLIFYPSFQFWIGDIFQSAFAK